MSILRKLYKASRALTQAKTRKGLFKGMSASYEHEALLAGLGPLQTIVDVGANVGQFALLSRIVHPQARVHSFEPISTQADVYDSVLGDDDQVTLHRTALGAEEKSADINITARADSSSLLRVTQQSELFPGTHKVGTETVQISRLTEILSADAIARPALLKIDVQGYEGEVLAGCEELLSCFDWIYCEMSFVELYDGQPLAHELIQWLDKRGFRVASVETDDLSTRNGRAVQADFLFSQASASPET